MSDQATIQTGPASSERSGSEQILSAHQCLVRDRLLMDILDSVPVMTAILDRNRQVVCANRTLIETFGDGNIEVLLGLRSGELMQCRRAWEDPRGCGTHPACNYCGALEAILAAQDGHQAVRDCRVVDEGGRAFDLQVTATPFVHRDEVFTILAIEDMADRRRREIMERAFFHDILNTAGNILGVVDLARLAESPEETSELIALAEETTELLIEEIRAQRDLLDAESHRLEAEPRDMGLTGFMNSLLARTRHLECATGKKIVLEIPDEDHAVRTDEILLGRAMVNLVKNALEASDPGQVVTVGFRHEGDETVIWVHNPDAMTEAVRHQVFQRSFSTKGPGRGLGTYSVKLLVEQHLHGRVDFTTAAETGTVFTLTIPDFPDR